MLRIFLLRPGCTDFDQQQRIQGSLDLPLNEQGQSQVRAAAEQLADEPIDTIYIAPNQASRQTAELVAPPRAKIKELESLINLDHGLWHGKLISEVRQHQPKVYRQWQEHPETVCPPEGERLQDAQQRVRRALVKMLKRHKEGAIAIVVSEPLASMIRTSLSDAELGDLWQGQLGCGQWEQIEVGPERLACM